MLCPYCRTPLQEESPECPGCRLNLARASALLGPVPRVAPGIDDPSRALPDASASRLHKRIDKFHERFPQVRLQILFRTFPDEQPYELYLFWIFNLGRIFSELEKGGANRGIMTAVDPHFMRSGMMTGYGLEPFLSHEALDEIISQADADWAQKDWESGMMKVLDATESLLEDTIHRISEIFDHHPHPVRKQPDSF